MTAPRAEHRVDGAELGAADWLGLMATPTFAAIAVAAAANGGGARDILCAAAQGSLPFSGMTTMYALMSAFHAAPWVRLIGSRHRGAST